MSPAPRGFERALAAALAGCALLWAGCGGSSGDEKDRPRAATTSAVVGDLRSRSDLKPPTVAVDRAQSDPDDRLIFVSPRMENPKRDAATHQQGGLAVDQRGRTRWFRPSPDGQPLTDLRVQRYRGKPVLTWWQGTATKGGVGSGDGVIVDESYREIARIKAGRGQTVDLHEILLTPRGTALLTIYGKAKRDLTSLGGARDAAVIDGIVQEVDIESGEVLFEWSSLDHVPIEETWRPTPKKADVPHDYFHINSVAEDAEGDFLISARNTNGVYKIDRETGKVVWRLGGEKSDFDMGPGTEFGIQHDARWLADDVVQIFDNIDRGKNAPPPSLVKRIKLDEENMTATLEQRFEQPDGMWAHTQGNAQPLADGGVMAGWGSTGAFSRLDARGNVLFDAHLPANYDTYRAYLAEWTGRPAVPPAVRAKRDSGQVTVAVSWNGSTEVERWQVLAGPSPEDLRPLGGTADWRGLETTLIRATDAPYVAVAALDANGQTLETSAAVRVQGAPEPPPAS